MSTPVSDSRSNHNDQIDHAVTVLGKSANRLAVFQAIYTGRSPTKTVAQISKVTGLSRQGVLDEGKRLANNHIVKQCKVDGDTAYTKDPFYTAQKRKVLSFVKNPKKLSALHTKTRPKISKSPIVTLKIPKNLINIKFITIDHVESFAKVRKIKKYPSNYTLIPEKKFKAGILKIIQDKETQKDWGGEINDIFSTKLKLNGRRVSVAFALKGPGKKGKLYPKDMGKRGDQIQRLFRSPAVVFFVQYWGAIDQSVLEQLQEFAKAKSYSSGDTIYFGIIDGEDSNRIMAAYPKLFK